jgi:hypothetical protein
VNCGPISLTYGEPAVTITSRIIFLSLRTSHTKHA